VHWVKIEFVFHFKLYMFLYTNMKMCGRNFSPFDFIDCKIWAFTINEKKFISCLTACAIFYPISMLIKLSLYFWAPYFLTLATNCKNWIKFAKLIALACQFCTRTENYGAIMSFFKKSDVALVVPYQNSDSFKNKKNGNFKN